MASEEDSSMSLSSAQRIDRACDLFEVQMKRGERPSIEEYVKRAARSDRRFLLRELLALEISDRLKHGDAPELTQYLDRFPGLDRRWLSSLIDSSSSSPDKSDSSDQPTIGYKKQQPDSEVGESIKYFGDYELLSEIARGGMGVVYKARQVSLDRIVAIKRVLSGTLASDEEVDRFYAEARAAAQLDHPNIVPLYEVGSHEGLHYLSMGFVDGQGLDRLTADVLLEPREAARILMTVADAIQFAHEKGIIHRDLKPSNILIDSKGVPKVTDFGLAKRLDDHDGLTLTGQILGTPSYMPPEQAAGKNFAIGPHSDIYSLGAVLYVLLTGRPPFKGVSAVQTLTQVLEREPISPIQLNANVPRDLETIVLKCLEKAIPRRYATAKDVADELRRYLEGRPIIARPIGRIHRTWRWCRRNPVTSALSFSLVAALMAGATISGWFAWQERQRAVSEEAARIEAQTARGTAERQRDIAQGLNDLLTKEILGQADIWNQAETESSVDPDITIKATLDRASSKVAERFVGKPEIEGAIRRSLGSAFTALGEPSKGIQQLEKAIELSVALPNQLPEEKKAVIETEYLLAKSYWLAQRPQEADAAFRSCLKKANEDLGPTSRERLVIQTSLAFIHLGRDSDAMSLLEELLPIVEGSFAPDDTDVLHYRNTLGLAQQSANQMGDALASFTTGHAHAKSKLGDKNPLTMMLLNNRARWYLINKQPAQGLEIFEQLEPLVSEQLGQDNPNAILTRCNLAYCYFDVGKFTEAGKLLETVVPAMQEGLGPQNPMTRKAKLIWAKALRKSDRIELATTLFSELISSALPDQPPIEIVPGLVGPVAKQLLEQGSRPQFLQLVKTYLEFLSDPKEVLGIEVADEIAFIGELFVSIGDIPSAADWTRKSLDLRLKLAPIDWRTNLAEITMSELLFATDQADQAQNMLSRAWNVLKPQLELLVVADRERIVKELGRVHQRLQSSGKVDSAQYWREQIDAIGK